MYAVCMTTIAHAALDDLYTQEPYYSPQGFVTQTNVLLAWSASLEEPNECT